MSNGSDGCNFQPRSAFRAGILNHPRRSEPSSPRRRCRMQPTLRHAVFAGSWYPARAAECEAEIRGFHRKEPHPAAPQPGPRRRHPAPRGLVFFGRHRLQRDPLPEKGRTAGAGCDRGVRHAPARLLPQHHDAEGRVGNPFRRSAGGGGPGRRDGQAVSLSGSRRPIATPRTTPSSCSCRSSNIFSRRRESWPWGFRRPRPRCGSARRSLRLPAGCG